MKRILLALACICMVLALSPVPPAHAEHSSKDFYQEEISGWLADAWLEDVNRNYCFDGWGVLTSGEKTNMINTTIEQINEEWEDDSLSGVHDTQ